MRLFAANYLGLGRLREYALRIRAQVFFTVGFIDHICPPTGIYAAFNQLVSRTDIWPHLDTGDGSCPDYEARVRDEVLAFIRAPAP